MLAIIFKTALMYVAVVAAMRIMGKRQLGELEPSEFVTAIIISEVAAMPIVEENVPVKYAAAAVAVLVILEIVFALCEQKSLLVRKILCPQPSLLIDEGKIVEKELKRNRVTTDELISALRGKDITDPAQVRYAVLEPGGGMSVVKQGEPLPEIVISDGKRKKESPMNDRQIRAELKKHGAANDKDVMLLMMDRDGKVYYFPK